MKKLLLAMLLFVGMASVSFAQTKKEEKPAAAKVHTKADGTPDKRYKENKEHAEHMKKDGTPDMRYKENKGKEAAAPGHTKKDGTADKRFKENKEDKGKKKAA
ncbi:hypothetical protein [Asinibacterium sp. OR53]|jgi:hypothetical protein|uniref:hypothetical protein n=1 Tax=Asinibacterium sp. OR53 TaxID=925409 RepID=UPI000428517D|nr:hypothetical protein [Asinibacterium sp. OR53]